MMTVWKTQPQILYTKQLNLLFMDAIEYKQQNLKLSYSRKIIRSGLGIRYRGGGALLCKIKSRTFQKNVLYRLRALKNHISILFYT